MFKNVNLSFILIAIGVVLSLLGFSNLSTSCFIVSLINSVGFLIKTSRY